ncbi:MAG: prephenate dehydrogenase [Eggerthellaceae bacterium]|nr:prephenate dehydrogenase [Eggerthellaceae bacterium]
MTPWISDSTVLIVGLGLMGGSYAKALKRLGYRVCALARRQETIDYAIEHDIIDAGSVDVNPELVGSADAVVFALYPEAFKQWIAEHQHLLKPGALLTDVTGVKCAIVYDIQGMLRPDVEFIAAHPMAGKEVYGVENSDERMFRDANYIVTPTVTNTPEAVEWCKSLGKILGFRKVSVLSPEEHDEMIGFVSQLTHCIAVSLMTCLDNPNLVDYTGDSFRDLTRIARINDEMWSELFLLNKDDLLAQMDMFLTEFMELQNMLEHDDVEGMRSKMRLSTARRAYFDKPTGGALACTVADPVTGLASDPAAGFVEDLEAGLVAGPQAGPTTEQTR